MNRAAAAREKNKKTLAVIKGSVGMKVSNPAEFVKDSAVKDAIGDSIAKLVGISKDFVSVTLRVVKRLLTMQPRRLQEGRRHPLAAQRPARRPCQ